MKKIINIFIFVMAAWGLLSGCKPESGPEPHAQKILDQITETKTLLSKKFCKTAKCIFASFWDFDGTILKGDITNGLPKPGGYVFTGLQRRAIEKGYSSRFANYEDFLKSYERIEKAQGHAGAYRFLAAPFAGQSKKALEGFAKREFERNIHPYLFASSMKIFRALKKQGIRTYIISASADYFVSGTRAALQNPPEYMFGFVTEAVGDRLTGKVVEPFHYADGKTKRIRLILKNIKKKNPGAKVFVLAGFGNSYHTDGHFLKWIASQNLPAGKAISVMINEEVPPNEKHLFWLVTQKSTISGR